MGQKDAYVGDEALSKCGILSVSYPIQRGCIRDWANMEKVFHHTFYNELRVAPEEQKMLLIAPPHIQSAHRERLIQMMFETFDVPKMFLGCSSVMSLLASGSATGIVLESGDGVTHAVPIYEGHLLPHATNTVFFGGSDITLYLTDLMSREGLMFTTTAEREIVRDIKEKLAFVVESKEKMQAPETAKKSYELPDGQVITIAENRHLCTEPLFQSSLLGAEFGGVHNLLLQSVLCCDTELRNVLFGKILLSGGNTLFPGFHQRLQNELAALLPPNTKLNITAPLERKYTSCVGGLMLAAMPSFSKMCIPKKEYDEFGPRIVSFKCF